MFVPWKTSKYRTCQCLQTPFSMACPVPLWTRVVIQSQSIYAGESGLPRGHLPWDPRPYCRHPVRRGKPFWSGGVRGEKGRPGHCHTCFSFFQFGPKEQLQCRMKGFFLEMEAVICGSLGPLSLFMELIRGTQSIILAASIPILIYDKALMDVGPVAQSNIMWNFPYVEKPL